MQGNILLSFIVFLNYLNNQSIMPHEQLIPL